MREWGGPGRELGKLQRPHGLDIDADGRLYVTEQSSERVQVLDIALDVDPEVVDPSKKRSPCRRPTRRCRRVR